MSYDDDSEGFSIHISSEVVDSFADKFSEVGGDSLDLRADFRVLYFSPISNCKLKIWLRKFRTLADSVEDAVSKADFSDSRVAASFLQVSSPFHFFSRAAIASISEIFSLDESCFCSAGTVTFPVTVLICVLNCQSSPSESSCWDASEDDSIRIGSSPFPESFDTILGPSSSLQVGKIVIFRCSGSRGYRQCSKSLERSEAILEKVSKIIKK